MVKVWVCNMGRDIVWRREMITIIDEAWWGLEPVSTSNMATMATKSLRYWWREPLSFIPSSTQVPQAYPSPWDCKFEGRVSKEIDRRHRTDNHTHSIIIMDQSAKSAWDIFWWWLSKPHWLHLQIRKSLTRFTYHFYETLFQVCGQAVSTRRLITQAVRFLVKKKFLRFHLFFSKDSFELPWHRIRQNGIQTKC